MPPLFASFAEPGLALGALAAALAVPLMIHLLFRQRERVIEWAAMRFLPAVKRRRNRRIDHWPLFLARCAALLLPLAAMCAVLPAAERLWQAIRPAPLEAAIHRPRTHTVLILDGTLSMTAARDGESLFEIAKEKCQETIRAANPGDGFSVILLDGTASVLVPGPSNHFDVVAAEIEAAKPWHGPGDLSAGLTAALDLLARSPAAYPRRRVLVFTDSQRSAFAGLLPGPDRPSSEVWAKLLARADVAIVDVGLESRDNLAVADLTLADPLPLVDDPALATVTVRNASRQDRRQVRVELSLARPAGGSIGPLVPLGQRVIDSVPALGQASVSFTLEGAGRFRAAGPHVLRARLVEPDALAADDARALAFDVRDGLNVLLVNGRPSGSPLRRASEFFAEALAPGGRLSPGNPFRPRTVSVDEFTDAVLSDLAGVDCVVLCDVPAITPSQIARLEALLKRGGGVIVALGPHAAANGELYNRLLGPVGAGFLPGTITGSSTVGDARLVGTDAAFKLPPLSAFQDANARAALASVPFTGHVTLDLPVESPARVILSFADSKPGGKPVAALLEAPKHRGRVVVFASTLNREWTDWPVLPSFLPFAHELVRFAAGNRDPRTLMAGEAVEEFFPAATVGQTATLTRPDGLTETATVGPGEDGGAARFPPTRLSGLYQVSLHGGPPRPVAVNVPNTAAGLAESDLRRIDAAELASLHAGLQLVTDPAEVKSQSNDDAPAVLTPRPHGPLVARWLAIFAIAALALELMLAWRSGPARSTIATGETVPRATIADRGLRLVAWLTAGLVIAVFAALLPAAVTGHLPEFVPYSLRNAFEETLAIPAAGPGEGTRWQFAASSLFGLAPRTDRLAVAGVIAALVFAAALLYRREARAVGRLRPLALPFLLRSLAYLLLGLVVLPQLRLVFEREGSPEVVILLDTSGSMATKDEGHDQNRLDRVRDWLLKDDGDWLAAFRRDRRMTVHVYSLAEQASLRATLDESGDLAAARSAVAGLIANGPSSRLGDGVESILKAHRGGALAAVIVASDGITTHGADLSAAGRSAARAGVPVFTVGVGDRREALDLALADLKMDDVVPKGDELVVEARVLVRGTVTGPLTVTLSEKRGDSLVPLTKAEIVPDAGGKPAAVRLKHRFAEAGEKTIVIDVPARPGELDTVNNRIERSVLVTEGRKLRVLLIDGRVRYEFRFLKTLFEREIDAPGERALDFRYLLLDAGKDFATTDRAALRTMPSRAELFEYDVVILGDVDPAALPRGPATLADLADFVRIRGGGLLMIAGEQALPAKFFDSPLVDLLPIQQAGEPPAPTPEDRPLTDGYRPTLTPLGRLHPLLRLASEDAENDGLWQRLPPMLWAAHGYTRRLTAEVLATHPTFAVEGSHGEGHPLILQQFAGAGRVLFFGFDETWRWRLRQNEELFNRFWRQAVRVLARNRVARAELRAAKPGPYRRDEPIALTVRFPDDAPPPTGPVRVGVERTSAGDRESSALVLSKVESTRATFHATLVRTPEGSYRFKLLSPADTKATTLDLTVLPPPGEGDRLKINAMELARAAGESGGKYYPVEAAETLFDDLPEGVRPPLNQPCPPLPLWNLPLTFATVLSLLGLEWLLRKRVRLL